MRFFPALLARKLAELFPEDQEREYSTPVQARMRVRWEDLMENMQSEWGGSSPASSSAKLKFGSTMEMALRTALGIPVEVLAELQLPERIPTLASTEIASPSPAITPEHAIEHLFLSWLSAGTLELHLSEFSAGELESWHAAICSLAQVQIDPESLHLPAAEQEAELLLAQLPSLSSLNRSARIRWRLILVARMAAQFQLPVRTGAFWHLLDRVLPLEQLEPTSEIAFGTVSTESTLSALAADSPQPISAKELPAAPPLHAPHPVKSVRSQWDAHIPSVLPFLLLGPLSRIGYFETLSAILEAAKIQEASPIFAAALAYKVLDPPDRGWRRTPASQLSAAVFAGQETHIPDEALDAFSWHFAARTGPLDRLVSEKIIEGHATGAPVAFLRAQSPSLKNYLLVDFPGCFPIALAAEIPELIALLAKLQKPILLVPQSAADPQVLQQFHDAGITFITDAPPSRNEHWQRVRQAHTGLGWTNHEDPFSSEIPQAGRHLSTATEESQSFWQALGVDRPGVVRASQPDLERCVTLAASLALGIISWKLWNSRGRTTPQLAIERFADLDARVRFDSEHIQVRLPLGRRYQELFESGLLTPVSGVPWLSARRLEFSGD
jgi:hypothetical protein